MKERVIAEPERIDALIDGEVDRMRDLKGAAAAALTDFVAHRQVPQAIDVQFSGGHVRRCWAVTRPNGPYQVVYMPVAGYFSLCVASHFGPLDIGVHGKAIDCFGSV